MPISFSIGLILLAAGFLQGLTGFGMGLVAMPLLCLIVDIKTAVPLVTLSSVVITATLFVQLRANLSPARILPLCLAAIPGIILGATLLKSTDPMILRRALGLLLAGYALYGLLARLRPRRISRHWSWPSGFVAGLLGASLSTGGPPVIVYTSMTDWSKDEVKATLTGYFLFSSLTVAATHWLSGITTSRTLGYFAVSIPFLLIGVLGGSSLYRRLPGEVYRKAILLGLLLMGAMMIILG